MSHGLLILADSNGWPGSVTVWGMVSFTISLAVQLMIAVRVIMSRRGVGETLAWLMLILGVPLVGVAIYLLIGELRLGSARTRRFQQLTPAIHQRLARLTPLMEQICWTQLESHVHQLAKTGAVTLCYPALPGNSLELMGNWQHVFDRLIQDIDSAKVNCDLQFYIWQSKGRTLDVVQAIERARQRGVVCRILVDSLGSWQFLKSAEASRLLAAGVEIREALPSRLWRLPFVRYDLRMHRKLVLIDDHIAWTGSLNLVDPRFFKITAKVGQWIDAMVRMEGPAVEALAIIFQIDWQSEADVPNGSADSLLPDLTGDQPLVHSGQSVVQVLPSGPAFAVDAIEQILLTAIYSAQCELIITSPYFVPSESLSLALASAAQRGVNVIVVSPARVDSVLVRYANRSLREHLLRAGVKLAFFRGGLLHTKSVTVDGQTSLFGTLNMDPRSLRLNFEITLAIYDPQFTSQLRQLQQSYISQSHWLSLDQWNTRGKGNRLLENLAKLVSPLL